MNETIAVRAPLGVRLLYGLRKDPDWSTISTEELVAFREATDRTVTSPLARLITGCPDRAASVRWHELALPDRELRVRVYRPSRERGGEDHALPLVLHVHGGGFCGTAVQCDWANSHLAARLPGAVVSVEHRLLAPGTPLPALIDDGWDALRHVVRHAPEWGVDPARIAVAGESTGGLVAALAAIRARESGLALRAQVLVNPVLDVSETAFDHASMAEHAHSPTLTAEQMRFFLRLAAVEPETEARAMSPLCAVDLSGLAPALVVVPSVDPLADHGRRYAERLRESATPVHLAEHAGATHAFLSMPGLVPQARPARAGIAAFLRERLAG